MGTIGTPSRRALTVLGLLRKAPEWRVTDAMFTATSRLAIGGLVLNVDRTINVSEYVPFCSQISVSAAGRLTAKRRERLVSTIWPAIATPHPHRQARTGVQS